MVSRKPSSTVCPECGADVPAGARRCPDCRAPVEPAVQPPEPQGVTHDTIVEQSLQRQVNAELARGGISPLLKPPGAARGERIDSAGIPVVSAKLIAAGQAARASSEPKKIEPSGRLRDITAQPTHVEKTPHLPQSALPPQPAAPSAEESMADTAPPAPHPARRGGAGGPRTIGLVAVELEDALEAGVSSWSAMDVADRITMLAAFSLAICTFLPWMGNQMGILVGGGVSWLFCVGAVALVLVRQRKRQRAQGAPPEEVSALKSDPAAIRRLNLLQILDGVGAVLYVLLVALGHYLGQEGNLKVSYGWYASLFLAMGLAYSGIARFARDARR